MSAELDLDDHAAMVTSLRDPAAFPHPVDTVRVVETHLSTVLLAGEYAYKLKKPVDLGFADFSTLERRRAACDDEVRLNRRTAESIYLGVVPVTRGAGEIGLRLGGAGEAIDYAVHMRRFDEASRADRLAASGRLDAALIDRLALAIADLHARCAMAPPDSAFGSPDSIRYWAASNSGELRRLVGEADAGRVAGLEAWAEGEFARRAPLFAERRARGFVRECHGDLHLGNVVQLGAELVPFDCIEFNAELRFIDVLSDLAFTWMDLVDHGLPQLAARLLNRYLEATGDYAGLATLRFYAVYRALVRSKVALLRRAQPGAAAAGEARDCERYLRVAETLAQPAPALLVLASGVTGSGKTTVAQHLLERLGAVRVRSDVERKRLAGLAPEDHSQARIGAPLYDTQATRLTYEQLARSAAAIVGAGFPAIVDATFLKQAERRVFRGLAQRLGAKFAIVACTAAASALRERVAARATLGADASDATAQVLAAQLASVEPPAEDERPFVEAIDTDTDLESLARRCAALAQRLAQGDRAAGAANVA